MIALQLFCLLQAILQAKKFLVATGTQKPIAFLGMLLCKRIKIGNFSFKFLCWDALIKEGLEPVMTRSPIRQAFKYIPVIPGRRISKNSFQQTTGSGPDYLTAHKLIISQTKRENFRRFRMHFIVLRNIFNSLSQITRTINAVNAIEQVKLPKSNAWQVKIGRASCRERV